MPPDPSVINKRDIPSTTGPSFFHNASHTNANNGFFNAVGGDQHVNIATKTDPDQERRVIAEWLSPLNFKVTQGEVFEIREEGTGQWLLDCGTFENWRDGQSEILWCPRNPGAGKTILTSIIIDHLETIFKDRNVAITYIYCNYKQRTEQSALNLVTSLLKQLVQDYSVAYKNVKNLYRSHKNLGTRPKLDEFLSVLGSEAERFTKVFIVMDALDECSEVDGTRGRLLVALRSLKGIVNLLVTSRDLASIAEDFRDTK